MVCCKFQYSLVKVIRGLESGYKPRRRKPNTSMIRGMSANDFPKISSRLAKKKVLMWIKGIPTHLYWSSMSTKTGGYGDIIVAK